MTPGAPKSPDTTGAKAANKISRWLEPLGEGRFPIDVDHLALTAHTMYQRDDPITRVHGADWKDIDGCLARNPANSKEWWLSYKSTASRERQRFTKAHELGHYVMHSRRQAEFRCGSAVITAWVAGVPGKSNTLAVTVSNCPPVASPDGGATPHLLSHTGLRFAPLTASQEATLADALQRVTARRQVLDSRLGSA